jgi:hypothetical protein
LAFLQATIASHDFGEGAFPVMQNFAVLKEARQFPGSGARVRGLASRLDQVHYGQQNSAWLEPTLRGLKEIALQVAADDDEVPGSGLDPESALLQVCVTNPERCGSLTAKDLEGHRRAIDRGDFPAAAGQPERVGAGVGSLWI